MTISKPARLVATLATLAACGGDSTTAPTPPTTPSTPTTPTTPTPPTPPTPTPPTPPSNPNAAYTLLLGIPSGTPAVGSKVTLWITAKRDPSAAKVGSFAAVVVPSDTSTVGFSAEVERTTDGIVAVNGQVTGVILAAGAAASGFSNDTLAGFSVVVKKTGGLNNVTLIIRELTTSAFEDKTAGAASPPPSASKSGARKPAKGRP